MIISCLIVDDEPLALDLMESYVRQTPFLRLVGRCSNAMEVFAFLEKEKVDLLFLDIQMLGLNGIEISKLLKDRTRVIFTTAYEQYAIDGYKVDAIDYLLKPVSYPDFLKAALKAQKLFEISHQNKEESDNNPGLFIKSDYRMFRVDPEDITFIEGEKDYVKIHTTSGESIMALMSMKSIEEQLDHNIFIRVHRSFIVNLLKIKCIERNRIMIGENSIPISDSYKKELMDKINLRILTK
jgi:two-component system LytT family response regulator